MRKEKGLSFTLEQLKAFIAVAETKSYSSGARKINRDRTTVREHIDNLQIALNAELIIRNGHNVMLTDLGRQYLRGASSIMFSVYKFEDFISNLNKFESQKSEYKISISQCVPNNYIVHVNKEIGDKFPNCNIKWVNKNNYEAREGVKKGIYDLAISRMVVDQVRYIPPSGLDGCYLGSIAMNIYTGSNSPLNKKKRMSFPDFINDTMYTLSDRFDEGEVEKCIYSLRHIQLVSYEQIITSILAGEGWAFLPEALCHSLVQNGQLIKLKTTFMNTSMNINHVLVKKAANTDTITNFLIDTFKGLYQHKQ
ncbi:LysR family transcriptional regulator [Vibrio zhanjiangensis]|uniref:LysR family transcriptional regulator n=1 Tax=Vibrio zhanjiangensis TaxID=1046128 RepID=A0ABQ6ESY2_9VIBR|nr:LysR family transcriptional regulator [Vibrio zhanjiangensis]GLT16267.1 LysR family transcriptional regulator [Vibrio zhanjiangensis]